MKKLDEMIRNKIESWIESNKNQFDELLESMYESVVDELDVYELLFNASIEYANYVLDISSDAEEIASEMFCEYL